MAGLSEAVYDVCRLQTANCIISRQIYRQTDIHTERQIDRQTDRQPAFRRSIYKDILLRHRKQKERVIAGQKVYNLPLVFGTLGYRK